ncbi:hypothetical protein AAVH_08176 [Aphelenchoides avenae]|nr:hypothetical protein AAVH_08176 [Aphelenchus avenae]
MPLPNEIWLDIYTCVDYGTLTAGWFTVSRISRLIRCNMERLALHQRLSLRTLAGAFGTNDIILELRDLNSGLSGGAFLYVHDKPDLQGLQEKVYLHGLFELSVNARDLEFLEKSLNALRAVKFVPKVSMYHLDSHSMGYFLPRFERLSKLELTVRPFEFDWTLLQRECLRRLTQLDLRIRHGSGLPVDTRDIVHYCFDFSLLPKEAKRIVHFRNVFFPLQFAADVMLAAINDRSERLFKVAFNTWGRFDLGPFEVSPTDLGNGRLRYARENPQLFIEIGNMHVMVTNDATETTPTF